MATAKQLAANIFSGMFGNIAKVGIQLVMLPLMARLLGPAELGLYALALPILSFVLLLSDAGLGDSLAREKSDNTLVWSSAFWGLMIMGTVLAVIVYASSFLIGHLAGQPRLPEVMLPLTSTLLMVAATIIPSALMLREGKMTYGSIGELVGTLVGAGIAIYMAYTGWGVWSMVAQYVVTFFIRLLVFNAFFPFWPKFEFSFKSLLSHSGVGGAIMGSRLLELASRVLENVQVSRVLGGAALGTYSYANQIGRFFSDAIGNPIWPNLYYMSIHGTETSIPKQFVRSNRIAALILFPGAALLAVLLPVIVPDFLGEKWVDSIHPMMVLLVTYPLLAMGNFHGAVLFAKKRSLIPLLGFLGVAVARVGVATFAGPLDLMGLAWGLSAVNVLYYLYVMFFVSKYIGNKPLDLAGAIIGPMIASAIAAACLYFMAGTSTYLPWLAVAGVIAFLIYAVALFVVDYRNVKDDLGSVKGMFKKH
jgi:O-antigen/teichoic acid export membrane protein